MNFEKWLENSSVLLECCFIFTNSQGFIFLFRFYFFLEKATCFSFLLEVNLL